MGVVQQAARITNPHFARQGPRYEASGGHGPNHGVGLAAARGRGVGQPSRVLILMSPARTAGG